MLGVANRYFSSLAPKKILQHWEMIELFNFVRFHVGCNSVQPNQVVINFYLKRKNSKSRGFNTFHLENKTKKKQKVSENYHSNSSK